MMLGAKMAKFFILTNTFIFLILFSSSVFSGQAYLNLKPEEGDMLKDGYRLVGEKYEDKFQDISGTETLVKIYRQNKKSVALFLLPNSQVYAYAYKNGKNPLVAYIDTNNDGNCDKTVDADEEFSINFSDYGFSAGLIQFNLLGK